MNWIEEVRGLLRAVRNETDVVLDDTWVGPKPTRDQLAGLVAPRIEKALAAIPDEPEMLELLGWLHGAVGKCIGSGGRNYISAGAYQAVIKYIEREFGYKLPEEDSVKENDSPEES